MLSFRESSLTGDQTCFSDMYLRWQVGSLPLATPGKPHFMQHYTVIICIMYSIYTEGFPRGSDGEESACNAGDLGSIPGLGRSPGGGHGHPLLYSCLENPMDRGAWRATVHVVTKSQTRLSY